MCLGIIKLLIDKGLIFDSSRSNDVRNVIENGNAKNLGIITLLIDNGVIKHRIGSTFPSHECTEISRQIINLLKRKSLALMCVDRVDRDYRNLGPKDTFNSKQMDYVNKFGPNGKVIYLATTHVDGTDGLANPIARLIMSFV